MANWAKVLWNAFMLINYTMLRKKLGNVEPTDYSKKKLKLYTFRVSNSHINERTLLKN